MTQKSKNNPWGRGDLLAIPRAAEPEETYAYNLDEIKAMLAVLPEPAFTVVLAAALTGLRKGELRGIGWEDFTGRELSVRRSVWNGITNEPKTRRSSAPIPVVKQLAEALEAHKVRMGKLAVGPIFKAGNGKPLNLDNLARRVIMPGLSRCAVCRNPKRTTSPKGIFSNAIIPCPTGTAGTLSVAVLLPIFTPWELTTRRFRRFYGTATLA